MVLCKYTHKSFLQFFTLAVSPILVVTWALVIYPKYMHFVLRPLTLVLVHILGKLLESMLQLLHIPLGQFGSKGATGQYSPDHRAI